MKLLLKRSEKINARIINLFNYPFQYFTKINKKQQQVDCLVFFYYSATLLLRKAYFLYVTKLTFV